MKELYEISFFPHVTGDITDKDEPNEEIVHEVINKFGNESKTLKKQKLLVYFGMRAEYTLSALGVLKIYGIDEYKEFIDKVISHEAERDRIAYFETFKYLIYLSSNIRMSESKEFKIFTIAHELQHVLQYLDFSCLHKKHSVLFRYFILRKLNPHKLPKEQDAIRKAKTINYGMFGKRDVDNFIDEKINKSREDNEKLYWGTVKSIDVDIDYDLENRVEEFWGNYEEGIKKEIKAIKDKKDELEDREKEFLDAYEDYLIKRKEFKEASGSQ